MFQYKGDNLLITIAYIVIALFGVVISLIFGYSHLASKPEEHEGKYEVAVDRTTGVEIGDRKMLDPNFEAFKRNALYVSLIMIGTLLVPFASFATGYYIVFKNQFDKKSFGLAIIYYVLFVVLLYVLLFVLSPVQVVY